MATPTTTFRLTAEAEYYLDRLSVALAPRGGEPLGRTAVMRLALRRVAEEEGIPPPSSEKKPEKKARHA